MSPPLIYLDQNIIGLQLEKRINLNKSDDLVWVYSSEHLAEIKRSKHPDNYLKTLNELDAKKIDLILDEQWQITGAAQLLPEGSPHQHYENYIEAISGADSIETLFDPLQAWINGGDCIDLLEDMPQTVAEKILELISSVPFDTKHLANNVVSMQPEFKSTISNLISNGNDIRKTRETLGDEKGSIGSVSGDNKIKQIWDIVSPTIAGAEITCDQFFGFEVPPSLGNESRPEVLGIIACCSILDLLGFQAEKKCRRLDKLPNVRSDASHIAMGSFCSAIMSADKRLIKRAQAVYEYKQYNISLLNINV